MKLQGCLGPFLGFSLFLFIFLNAPENSTSVSIAHVVAAVSAVKDIISIVKEVKSAVSDGWSFAENTTQGTTSNNLPQILSRFNEVGNDIKYIEHKHSEPVNNIINLKLLAKHNDITNTMNAITARFQEMQQYAAHLDNIESSTLMSFAEWTASPNGFSVYHLMDRLHLTMFGSDDKINKPGSNIFEMLVSSYGKEEKCLNQQSTQQFIYSLYTDIALTELKAYAMLEFSWIILRAYGKGNFTQEAEIMRKNYERRSDKTVRRLHEVMERADRIVWRCDPDRYVEGETYEQVTRFLQAYIENEVDMSSSRDCMQSCAAYGRTKNEGCYMDQFCAVQERCSGQIHDCYYASGNIKACPSALESLRRYEYIKLDDGRAYGKQGSCYRGESEANSWMRYVFWECSYCVCMCDDQNSIKTDRYFNLRETLSNVNDNKVVTGLRFTKKNRIFHLQIQEGQLLPRGMINESTLGWKPVDNYTLYERGVINNQDYFTLTYDARSIDLDNIQTFDDKYVVTGVRFQVVGAHLNLQARLSRFDFETGQLINPRENSYWITNEVSEYRRNRFLLNNADIPTHSNVKSEPDTGHNQYMKFSATSFEKDVAQTNVPFIDIQKVESKPPVPLAGIGIYHKGRDGYGGFLAPKIMTYDFAPHIQTPSEN